MVAGIEWKGVRIEMRLSPIGLKVDPCEYSKAKENLRYARKLGRFVSREDSEWLIDIPVPDLFSDNIPNTLSSTCEGCYNCCYFETPLRLLSDSNIPSEIPREGYFRRGPFTHIRANSNHIRFFEKEDELLVGFGCCFLDASGLCTIYGHRFDICIKFPEGRLSDCSKKDEKVVDTLVLRREEKAK